MDAPYSRLHRWTALLLSVLFVLGFDPLIGSRSCCASPGSPGRMFSACTMPCCAARAQMPACCAARTVSPARPQIVAGRSPCQCAAFPAGGGTPPVDLGRGVDGGHQLCRQAFAAGARISARTPVPVEPFGAPRALLEARGPDPGLAPGSSVAALRRLLALGAAGLLAVLGIARL